jgi:hypothetical protein
MKKMGGGDGDRHAEREDHVPAAADGKHERRSYRVARDVYLAGVIC